MVQVSAESDLAVSSGESGSVGPRASDTVSVAAAAVAKYVFEVRSQEIATVGKSIDESEARPPGFPKHSAATAAPAVAHTVMKSVDEARPPEIAKCSATTAFSAVAHTVMKLVDEARPPDNSL